jgi:ABC-type sulfate transport system permease component
MADIFAAVDLSTVAAFVAATGVVVIGIKMAFKGIDLGKRAVNKA